MSPSNFSSSPVIIYVGNCSHSQIFVKKLYSFTLALYTAKQRERMSSINKSTKRTLRGGSKQCGHLGSRACPTQQPIVCLDCSRDKWVHNSTSITSASASDVKHCRSGYYFSATISVCWQKLVSVSISFSLHQMTLPAFLNVFVRFVAVVLCNVLHPPTEH